MSKGQRVRRGPALIEMAKAGRPARADGTVEEATRAVAAITGGTAAERMLAANAPKAPDGQPLDMDKVREKLGE